MHWPTNSTITLLLTRPAHPVSLYQPLPTIAVQDCRSKESTCVFVCRPSRLELNARKCVEINTYTVSGKKETKMFSVISPITLRQFWWNLAYSFLNKFAATWCKHFPPHLNNVSTLPCETWNDHCASSTIALLDRETPEFIAPQLWSSNSPDLNPVDYSVWKILQEGVRNMHHWSGAIDEATDGWLPQW